MANRILITEAQVRALFVRAYWRAVVIHARYKDMWWVRRNYPKTFDRRKKLDRYVLERLNAAFKNPQFKIDVETARQNILRKAQFRPYQFSNIFANPIVVDYIAHKNEIKRIYADHLAFWGGRNHWAKNEHDIKILQVFSDNIEL